jgi:hypothetical protein
MDGYKMLQADAMQWRAGIILAKSQSFAPTTSTLGSASMKQPFCGTRDDKRGLLLGEPM